MVSATVVVPLLGLHYARHLPAWVANIKALDPAPAEAIVVYHYRNADAVWPIRDQVVLLETDSDDVAEAFNLGFYLARTEWLAAGSLDDRYLPEAFAQLPDAQGFDIQGWRARTHTGEVIGSNLEAVSRYRNAVLFHSPFTRDLFDRVGPWPPVYWHDWGFWLKAKAAGARMHRADGVQVIYDDVDPGRLSTTAPADADEQIRNLEEQ